jgi:hypothetical protein
LLLKGHVLASHAGTNVAHFTGGISGVSGPPRCHRNGRAVGPLHVEPSRALGSGPVAGRPLSRGEGCWARSRPGHDASPTGGRRIRRRGLACPEEVALPVLAVDLDQGGELLGRVDALTGDPDSERVGQRHDRVDDRAAFLGMVDALDETTVNLEEVQRQLAEGWTSELLGVFEAHPLRAPATTTIPITARAVRFMAPLHSRACRWAAVMSPVAQTTAGVIGRRAVGPNGPAGRYLTSPRSGSCESTPRLCGHRHVGGVGGGRSNGPRGRRTRAGRSGCPNR